MSILRSRLGYEVRRIRLERGMRQKEMGELLFGGVSSSRVMLSRLERGELPLSVERVDSICEKLGVVMLVAFVEKSEL